MYEKTVTVIRSFLTGWAGGRHAVVRYVDHATARPLAAGPAAVV